MAGIISGLHWQTNVADADARKFEALGFAGHPAAALSALPSGANLSRLHLPRLPKNVRALRDLQSEVRARARIFSGSHVRQLRIGTGNHCLDRGASVERYFLVDRERYRLGVRIVLAAGSVAHAVCPRVVDLPGSDHRSRSPNLRNRGRAALRASAPEHLSLPLPFLVKIKASPSSRTRPGPRLRQELRADR